MKLQRVKYLYRVIDQRAGETQYPLMTVSIHHGVVRRDTLTDDLPRAEDLSNYKVCDAGDIVLNRMRAFQGAVGVCPQRGIVSPDYIVLRPTQDADPRYLHHLFRSSWFVGEMASRLRGIGNTENGAVRTPRINPEEFGGIAVEKVSLDEQRRIADFLDAETTRIDRLVQVQRSVASLISERRRRVLNDTLITSNLRQATPASWGPLGYLTEYGRPIMYGIVLPGPNVEDGIPIVKGGDIAAGRLSLGQLNKTTREIEASFARSRVRMGDIVIAIRGSVGEVAMVPEEITGANLTQDAARIAPGPDVYGRWLELVLQTSPIESQIRSRITGATVKGINIWDLRRILVPKISRAEQIVAFEQAKAYLTNMAEILKTTERQVALLSERRTALIATAIAGGIDVVTAHRSGGAP